MCVCVCVCVRVCKVLCIEISQRCVFNEFIIKNSMARFASLYNYAKFENI